MFRLIKLAMFGLFGYAAYEFIRGLTQDTQAGSRVDEGRNRLAGSRGQQSPVARNGGGMNITGPGRGEDVSTLDYDGGTTRHKVGRGVVS